MKKTLVRVLAFALVAVMLVCTLASCGKKLSGEYVGEIEILGQVNTETVEATYEIVENDDGTMEITFTTEVDGKEESNTVTFEEGDGYIKLGGVQYNKK